MEMKSKEEVLSVLEDLQTDYDGMTLVLEELLFSLRFTERDGEQAGKGETHDERVF